MLLLNKLSRGFFDLLLCEFIHQSTLYWQNILNTVGPVCSVMLNSVCKKIGDAFSVLYCFKLFTTLKEWYYCTPTSMCTHSLDH